MAKKQYMFVAGADACGACAGLDGTISDAPLGQQHDNCKCQDEPVDEDDDDCPQLHLDNVSVQTAGSSVTLSAEITVSCCDGSEIQQSVEVELGERSSSPSIEEAFEALAPAALELTPDDCDEGVDVWVEEGEEEGLA